MIIKRNTTMVSTTYIGIGINILIERLKKEI